MNPLGMLSYGLAAAAYLALSLMLLTGWRPRFHGSLMLPASLVSLLWSTALAWQAASGEAAPTGFLFFLEIARDTLWLAVLMRVLSGVAAREIPGWIHGAVYASAGAALLGALLLGV